MNFQDPTYNLAYEQYFFEVFEYIKKFEYPRYLKIIEGKPEHEYMKDLVINNLFYDSNNKGVDQANNCLILNLYPPRCEFDSKKTGNGRYFISCFPIIEIFVRFVDSEVGVLNENIDPEAPNYIAKNLVKNINTSGHQILPYERMGVLRSWISTIFTKKIFADILDYIPDIAERSFASDRAIFNLEEGFESPLTQLTNEVNAYHQAFTQEFTAIISQEDYRAYSTLETVSNDLKITTKGISWHRK